MHSKRCLLRVETVSMTYTLTDSVSLQNAAALCLFLHQMEASVLRLRGINQRALLQLHSVTLSQSIKDKTAAVYYPQLQHLICFCHILAFLCKIYHNHLNHPRNLLQRIVLLFLFFSVWYSVCARACVCPWLQAKK